MSDIEKIVAFRQLISDGEQVSDTVARVYLTLASEIIINKAFPFCSSVPALPSRYDMLQCRIAAYLYLKRDADGQTSHSENGVSINYENGDIPSSMLREITPMCGVIGE